MKFALYVNAGMDPLLILMPMVDDDTKIVEYKERFYIRFSEWDTLDEHAFIITRHIKIQDRADGPEDIIT